MNDDINKLLPLIPLRDIVVYPGMVAPLFVGREKSVKALEEAMNADKAILLATQLEAGSDDPTFEDINKIGTMGKILQLLRLPDGTVKVLVEDESGVLTRIAGLFARRGFNIESLAVGPAEEVGISRITMVVPSDERTIEQLTKQLYKLVNILKVEDITNLPCIQRELMLIKIKTELDERSKILEIATVFRAHIVDLSENSIIIEATGDPGKIAALEQLLSKFAIQEIARTGKISLVRGSQISTNYINSR